MARFDTIECNASYFVSGLDMALDGSSYSETFLGVQMEPHCNT